MTLRSVFRQRAIASLLVCALLAPSLALAKSRKKSDGQPKRKGAIVLLVAGIGFVALGAVALTRSRSSSCNGGWTYDQSGWGYPCVVLPVFKNLDRDRQIVGGVSLGVGGLMTAGGIAMLARRHKPAPVTTPDPKEKSQDK